MKKQYIKPTTTTLKVQGSNTLMSGSGRAHLNGSVEGIQPDKDFGIDITWGGSSKQDTQDKDDQGRLWAD